VNWNFDIGETETSEKPENGLDQQYKATSKTESKGNVKTFDKFKDMFSDSEA
jgi:hypothetical protein